MLKISGILDKQKRHKYMAIVQKKTATMFAPTADSKAVFVFGRQRSGTTMLMQVFYLHPDTEVYNEGSNNKAFKDFVIRGYDVLTQLITKSKAQYVCFKPIKESHKAKEFTEKFPNCRMIWIYRNYKDVANSSLRKFPKLTTGIKAYCNNEERGKRFEEYISEETGKTLRHLHTTEKLSEFDFSCLIWWARNRNVVEQSLHLMDNIFLIKYEHMVTKPKENFYKLFDFIGLEKNPKPLRDIFSTSIGKDKTPPLHPAVKKLCDDLTAEMDQKMQSVG